MRPVFLLLLLASACDDLPRDVGGTSEAIASRGSVRVGIATDSGSLPGERVRAAALLKAIGLPAEVQRGATEPMLTRLSQGELDLVLTPTAKDTPWKTRVHFGPAIAAGEIAGEPHELRPATMNGENAWIGRVHRAAVSIGGKP